MSCSDGIRIIAGIFLLMFKVDVGNGQTGGPNAVALINGQTKLDCLTSLMTASSWTRTTDGASNPLQITNGCSVTGNNAAYYRTEQPEVNICRLIIANVTMQQAGVYECYAGSGGTVYRSLVTVIDPIASVVVYNQSTEVVDADQLNISCSINYNGPASPAPSLRPSPYWITSPEQIYTSATYHPSTKVVTLIATVTVQKPTVPIFRCYTVLEITGSSSGYNATPPSENFTIGATTELDVQYGPSTPTISHGKRSFTAKDGSICTLTTLTCTSTANPAPHYTWKDVTNGKQLIIGVNGNVFDWAEDNRTYECTANNNIRNVNRSMSTVYTVGVSSSRPCVSVNSKDIGICSDDGRCDNGTTTRSCSNGSHIYLTCNITSNVFPKPTICQWKDASGNIWSNSSTYNATMNGDYTVLVYNEINQQTNTPAVANVRVTDCLSTTPLTRTGQTPTSVSTSQLKTIEIVIAVVVSSWVLLNLIAMSAFLIYYNGTDPNGKHEHKKTLNNSLPWLKPMLPCFNETSDGGCSRCLWCFLFVLMSITVGLIVFPSLLIRVNCRCCAKDTNTLSTSTSTSQETKNEFSQIGGRGDEGAATSRGTTRDHSQPSSEARRDPIPYEECIIPTSPRSETHQKANKETKQREKSTIPKYAKVNKTNKRPDDQESDPYSVIPNPDNIDVTHKRAVPLPPIKPPHQTSAQNPNAPFYGELNFALQSNFRKPVQFMTEESDTQYAPLKST